MPSPLSRLFCDSDPSVPTVCATQSPSGLRRRFPGLEQCLSKLILFGEASLRHVPSHYADHFHNQRNHQGKANAILFPAPADRVGESSGETRNRERLGGLPKFHHREAA